MALEDCNTSPPHPDTIFLKITQISIIFKVQQQPGWFQLFPVHRHRLQHAAAWTKGDPGLRLTWAAGIIQGWISE